MKKIIVFISFLTAFSPVMAQTEIFVSPKGNDRNPGTEHKPLASLSKAKELSHKSLGASKESTIYLREGNYFTENTIRFDENDSGLEVKAYNNEQAVIYGGIRVTVGKNGKEIFTEQNHRFQIPFLGYTKMVEVL